MNTPNHVTLVQYKHNSPLSELEKVCEHKCIAKLNGDDDLDQDFN